MREGEFLGILGATGSGKSTVLSLILRLYDATRGEILLDGRDIKGYNPLWLRRHVGYVSQEPERTLKVHRSSSSPPISVNFPSISEGSGQDRLKS